MVSIAKRNQDLIISVYATHHEASNTMLGQIKVILGDADRTGESEILFYAIDPCTMS
jgi:hypothetical protein